MATLAPAAGIAARMQSLIAARYVRYAGASVIALGADVALFGGLALAGVDAALAAALGYAGGIGVHWLASTRFVFADRTASHGSRERAGQRVGFVLSALIGLALTWATVALVVSSGAPAIVAKLIAVVVSFQAVWLVRRSFVFGRRT